MVDLRSQRGEKGRPRSASLSPWKQIQHMYTLVNSLTILNTCFLDMSKNKQINKSDAYLPLNTQTTHCRIRFAEGLSQITAEATANQVSFIIHIQHCWCHLFLLNFVFLIFFLHFCKQYEHLYNVSSLLFQSSTNKSMKVVRGIAGIRMFSFLVILILSNHLLSSPLM